MFWLVLLGIVLLAVVIGLYLQHHGVRASVKQGNQMHREIHRSTESTKAEMDRIAREWKDRQ